MSSRWRCEHCGEVEPYTVLPSPTPAALARVAALAAVPLWVPWPPPYGWTLGGVGWAGDERSPAGAAVSGWCGPHPLGGPAEMLLVAEEMGLGVGARYAGVPGLDAGGCVTGAPFAKVEVGGHPVALWPSETSPQDRLALVGEAEGRWLWMVLFPAPAGVLLAERLLLADARAGHVAPPVGAPSTRL